MKIRNGFISNSSSSSFIIAKAYLSDAQIEGLRIGLDNIDNGGSWWGDSEMTWEEQGKYFIMETRLVRKQISDLFEKLSISWEDGYRHES